ncbi:hypothetical protein FQN54_008854 [Arachnomyces sp. PD_36]|nr:hypothetical protein FQN54_008854 [Arachnomyces sp. PD_36]
MLSPSDTQSLSSDRAQQTPQSIISHILGTLPTVERFTEIIYEHVSPKDGVFISDFLAANPEVERRNVRITFNAHTGTLRVKICLTELHNAPFQWAFCSHGDWIFSGLLDRDEIGLLCTGAGTTFNEFTGPYHGSRIDPDLFIRTDVSGSPSIVMGSGWSETLPYLREDKDLWMEGSSVELVILLKWTNLSNNKVKGDAEVWRHNAEGTLVVEELPIFPEPTPLPASDRVIFTRSQLFGQATLSHRDPEGILYLGMPSLRDIARKALGRMGLIPAEEKDLE